MKKILILIVLSQFLCTASWFAGNAVMSEIAAQFNISVGSQVFLASAVQAGFIVGTLLFAIYTISDRFSPSKVFFISAIIAAIFNLGVSFDFISYPMVLFCRFMTGFFLAGIYPVGMKLAADHYEKGLAKSLGFLVGALVLGTAFPHLLKSSMSTFPWRYVLYGTSFLALIGGLLIYIFVPDGPYHKKAQALKLNKFLDGFKQKEFRAAAIGYFGHQWELYAFWVFLPAMLIWYNKQHGESLNVPLFTFLIILSGAIACVIGGLVSNHFGAKKIAGTALTLSGVCCLLSPLLLIYATTIPFIAFLIIWGMAVAADSPQFSTLVAQNAPPAIKGTSITIVTSIGFAITIVTIQGIGAFITNSNTPYIFMFLAIGPVVGLKGLFKK